MRQESQIAFDVGQVILTEPDADGIVHVGVDVPGGEEAGSALFESHHPFGLDGRPRDPDKGADGRTVLGCSVLHGYFGNDRHAWPLGDPRALVKLPVLPKGSTRVWCDTGRPELPAMVLDGDTGSWTLACPHLGGGSSSSIRVDVGAPGAEEIAARVGSKTMLVVRALETVVGGDALARPVAHADTVVGLVTALQAAAAALAAFAIPPSPLTPLAAIGTALQGALNALPPALASTLRAE